MFHGEGGVHSDIFRGHWFEPEDGPFGVIYDVVSAAELVLVEFQIQFIRIGEWDTDFPEHLYDLVAPVVDMVRGHHGGKIFPSYHIQLGDAVEIESSFWVDMRPPTRRKVRGPNRASGKD